MLTCEPGTLAPAVQAQVQVCRLREAGCQGADNLLDALAFSSDNIRSMPM